MKEVRIKRSDISKVPVDLVGLYIRSKLILGGIHPEKELKEHADYITDEIVITQREDI